MTDDDWIELGALRLLSVADGLDIAYDLGDVLGWLRDVPLEDVPDEVRQALDADGALPIPYRPTLIRAEGATILVDAGAGAEAAAAWEIDAGHTVEVLTNAGVDPAAIDIAVITHAHPDHLAGFLQPGDDGTRVPTFPGARHVLAAAEWRYWVDGEPSGPSAGMAPHARRDLTALRDAGVLELAEGAEELTDGVRLHPTPGHTPGHMCVVVSSSGRDGLITGDAILSAWTIPHPDWTSELDVDQALTVTTRRVLLDRFADNGGLVFGYHLPPVGRVTRAGAAYTFVPV